MTALYEGRVTVCSPYDVIATTATCLMEIVPYKWIRNWELTIKTMMCLYIRHVSQLKNASKV